MRQSRNVNRKGVTVTKSPLIVSSTCVVIARKPDQQWTCCGCGVAFLGKPCVDVKIGNTSSWVCMGCMSSLTAQYTKLIPLLAAACVGMDIPEEGVDAMAVKEDI